ncbi:hypothetical protein BU24DRAFT_147716 [Aaosphaeria arxii CBS 175.79]|uniref:CENP-V/GFA domain-containing protein n=1 Tax=Aaosphaeria arxii CBS 175.79 TaxID=1450172 RepID=A0A6A5XWG7_9PLEO|nr:uncharacterized protein BU24DRAFT_147716 [Aaosphaeria arxii CBS 175.79]KAF2017296.1 hypothetical protein BU24DRAFT_147716 [Aaosphaeria arxii CBS 175.79]
MSDNKFSGTLPDENSSEAETYDAVCHCGTVEYSVTLTPPLPKQKVVSCNCSICSRNGYLLVYPLRAQFNLKSGDAALKTYSFGKMRNHHKFCGRCGSSVFFDPRLIELGDGSPDLLGVNVRMFKNVKLDELEIVQYDGKNQMPDVSNVSHLQ